jgi:hypothetical protein
VTSYYRSKTINSNEERPRGSHRKRTSTSIAATLPPYQPQLPTTLSEQDSSTAVPLESEGVTNSIATTTGYYSDTETSEEETEGDEEDSIEFNESFDAENSREGSETNILNLRQSSSSGGGENLSVSGGRPSHAQHKIPMIKIPTSLMAHAGGDSSSSRSVSPQTPTSMSDR